MDVREHPCNVGSIPGISGGDTARRMIIILNIVFNSRQFGDGGTAVQKYMITFEANFTAILRPIPLDAPVTSIVFLCI